MALKKLSRGALVRLAGALETGRLAPPFQRRDLEEHVPSSEVEATASTLRDMHDSGMQPVHLALVLGLLADERAETQATADRFELVWSGTEVEGSATRDTAVVVQELFRQAKRSVLVASYALDGDADRARPIFKELAERMDAEPALDVTLFVNVHRDLFETACDDDLLKNYATWFREKVWSGRRLPKVFYDPRSLRPHDGGKRACLHAKCVVIDEVRALITSANFTEAAHRRNLEGGVVIEDARIASSLTAQFASLLRAGQLSELESRISGGGGE